MLLYELLAGSPPFTRQQLQQAGIVEMLRMIREQEPPRPSARLSTADALPSLAASRGAEPRRLTSLLSGDLDWIVMRSMEKDRARRYQTASAFAADLNRYLADEPVEASPPSARYRFRKFTKRNRAALLAGSIITVAVLGSVGAIAGSIGWAVRDRASRQAAVEIEARQALSDAEREFAQEHWIEAVAEARRAHGLLAVDADSELRSRADDLRRDAEMVIAIERSSLLAADANGAHVDWNIVDREYQKAFADYGIDVLSLPPEESARRIRAASRLKTLLIVTLDDWVSTPVSRGNRNRDQIRRIAVMIDDDPWRQKVRDATDAEALATLANSPDVETQPRTSLVVLKHALMFHGQRDQSIEILRLLRRKFPDDFLVNYWLATELFEASGSNQAEYVSAASAAVALRPRSSAAYLTLASALRRSGNSKTALYFAKKCIELAPQSSAAYNELGMIQSARGEPDEALNAYERAVELDPNDGWPHLNLGLLMRSRKRYDEAVAHFQETVRLSPDWSYGHTDLGLTYDLQGKTDEAEACFRKAIEVDPANYRAWHHLGRKLVFRGEVEEGAEKIRQASLRNPGSATIKTELAAVETRVQVQGKIDAAREQLSKAPDDATLHVKLGELLHEQGTMEAAVASFRTAMKIDPNLASAVYGLIDALILMKRQDEAIESVRDTLGRINVADAYHRGRLSYSYARLCSFLVIRPDIENRRPEEAVRFANEAKRLVPTLSISTLALARFQLGQYPAALEAIETSMQQRGGGDTRDWLIFAMIHWKMGRPDLARYWRDTAVRIMSDVTPPDALFEQFRGELEAMMKIPAGGDAATRPASAGD